MEARLGRWQRRALSGLLVELSGIAIDLRHVDVLIPPSGFQKAARCVPAQHELQQPPLRQGLVMSTARIGSDRRCEPFQRRRWSQAGIQPQLLVFSERLDTLQSAGLRPACN